MKIQNLNIPRVLIWRLEDYGFKTVQDIACTTEPGLLKFRLIGKTAVNRIKEALYSHGLHLGTDRPQKMRDMANKLFDAAQALEHQAMLMENFGRDD